MPPFSHAQTHTHNPPPTTQQIFLEPEGRNTPELYVQGFSTGLPERLQRALLRTLPGLEQCAVLRPAYAVEYDYLPATQCHATLETKRIGGLFFSGQLNGTTGEFFFVVFCEGARAGATAATTATTVRGQPVARAQREGFEQRERGFATAARGLDFFSTTQKQTHFPLAQTRKSR
jgi:glucose-inhibited division protein A